MPDLAVEAARLGIPYTNPKSTKFRHPKSYTQIVADPTNPYEPPRARRVIEIDGHKGGFWSRMFGGRSLVVDEKVCWEYLIAYNNNGSSIW
jgi:hypothetical protein